MEITPFGEAVRQLRIKARVRLNDMSKAMGYSQTYLSAVETGRKPLHNELVIRSIKYFSDLEIEFEVSKLHAAADATKTELSIEQLLPGARGQVVELVRRLESMDEHQQSLAVGALQKLIKRL